jgi:hypothetical protein
MSLYQFPRYKKVQLYKDQTLGSDRGTVTFPLKTNDLITQILVQCRAKNGATNNDFDAVAEATIERSITGITMNSGSAIFKQYDGEMCRKIATYRNGRLPNALITGVAGGTWAGNQDPELGWQTADFPLDFCLKQDPYGNKTGVIFPAPLYNALDLRIDFDFTISATAGFVTGSANHLVDIYALTVPSNNISKEMLKSKKILTETKKVDYTTLATGIQAFDLTYDPARYLRQLFVNCYAQGVGEGTQLTDVQLNVNGNNEISSSWGNLQAENALDCNLNYEKWYYGDPSDGTSVHYTRVPAPIATVNGYQAPTIVPWLDYDNDTVTVTNDSGELYLLNVRSDVLPGMVVFDLDKDNMCQNLQPCDVNDLELKVTNGTASGAVQILEQHYANPWGY